MALDLDATKQLTRLQGAVEGVLGSIRIAKGGQPLDAASDRLDALIAGVRDVLVNSDPELAGEFDRIIVRTSESAWGAWGADASASVLLGWLRGLVVAEQAEAQATANAKAYADAKVREERTVGFAPGEQPTG